MESFWLKFINQDTTAVWTHSVNMYWLVKQSGILQSVRIKAWDNPDYNEQTEDSFDVPVKCWLIIFV